ncbi:hypothetical protein GQ53DRAFT_91878 [Thozetella sp. PMI_491]|nr:hypothetical protein GQ53DRAFT_91878 [Thozetella sp. PMI_491]
MLCSSSPATASSLRHSYARRPSSPGGEEGGRKGAGFLLVRCAADVTPIASFSRPCLWVPHIVTRSAPVPGAEHRSPTASGSREEEESVEGERGVREARKVFFLRGAAPEYGRFQAEFAIYCRRSARILRLWGRGGVLRAPTHTHWANKMPPDETKDGSD